MNEPFEYSQILYNEVIMYLETKWNRKLNDHERHVLIEGYRFGRMVSMEGGLNVINEKSL
jgi:hypothetical protein